MVEKYEDLISQLMDQSYGVVEDFIDENLRKSLAENLRSKFQQGEMAEAGIGRISDFKKDRSYRSDLIHWLENDTTDEVEQAFLNQINDFMAYLNRTCFTALKSYEIHYALFQEGKFFKRHLDQFKSDSGRKFSIVCYLNDDWKPEDGGELVLYCDEPVIVLPKGGSLVFFKSDELEHEVKPAFRERLSLTGWMKVI